MRQTKYKLGALIIGGRLLALAAMVLPAGAAAEPSPLETLQQKCAPWKNFPAPKPRIVATMPEYRAWLHELEQRNPHTTWQQAITFLHRDHQTGDEGLSLPLLGNTFVNGPENAGSRGTNFDTACYANTPTGRKERHTPYYVIDDLGRTIDITHIYAGIRSDFNRDRNSWQADLMRRMNTDWGDHFQDIAMPDAWIWHPGAWIPTWKGGYAPPDQLLGDSIGLQASDKFRAFGNGPQSWASVILQAIEEAVREEEFARDAADLLPKEDRLTDTRKSPVEAQEEAKQKLARENERKRIEALCDPRNNAQPKNNPDPGWIAVETADKGPDFVDREECRPYGPPAKRFEYMGRDEATANKEQEEIESQPALKQARCARLVSTADAAGSQYASGEIETAKVTLEGILSEIDGTPREAPCPDVRVRVAGNLEKIKRLTDVLAEINESLTTCEPRALRHQHQQLKDATHVKLVSLREQLLRAVPVAENYALATAAYKEGRMDDADSLFHKALTRAKETDEQTCTDIEPRTRSNLERIEKAKELEKAVSDAVERCDMAAVEQRRAQLVGTTNPFLVGLHTRLGKLPARCTQIAADAHCQSTIGSGWTAGPPDERGQYYCRPPSKEAAHQWCEEHNDESGWVAGAVASNGSFGCFPSYARQKSAALASCSNQHGSRLIRVYRVKGAWYCSYRQETAKRRATTPRTTRRQPSGYDPRAAAAAAAIAGAVIQGIARSQAGRHGGGGNCAVNPRAAGC